MRQGQQNRRGRGRNRKGQSPLTRSFESTGPDVKIRGTPSHIAEKYMSLARDATSSGDPVLAENYLQHAEHYNRIIMAFRDQQIAQGGDMNGVPRARPFNEMDGDDFGDDDGDDGDMQPPMQQQPRHNDQQPRMEGQRFDNGKRHEQRGDQNRFRDRHEHRNNNRHDRNHDRPDRQDRQDRQDRRDHGGDQPGGHQPQRQRIAESADAGQPPVEGGFQRRDRFPQQQHEQPEFLRRPVRRPRREANGAPTEVNGAAADDTDRD
jgi:hypothetical protein